ncbi:MAG: hypothetical protein N2484_01315 [Clostridia bacterium]|nr:hypothetical protein [Clostridia bacterium]
MNKKILLTGVSIAAGCAMLFTTAFASMTGNTGYEIYKEAVKNTVKAKSFTADVRMTFKDNGKVMAEMDSTMKQSHEERAMSHITNAKVQDKEVKMETYANEDNVVLKKGSSDEYYLIKNDKKDFGRHDRKLNCAEDPEMSKAGEVVLDALVGDLKNYVSASGNSEGGSDVTIQLEGNQIPAVVNALASLGAKGAAKDGNRPHAHGPAPFDENFDLQPPKLVDDIKITKVDVKAKINKDKTIESQIITAVLTGKDAEGKSHQIEFSADMKLKNVNSTTVDKVDLTGKQVKELKPEDIKGEHSR